MDSTLLKLDAETFQAVLGAAPTGHAALYASAYVKALNDRRGVPPNDLHSPGSHPWSDAFPDQENIALAVGRMSVGRMLSVGSTGGGDVSHSKVSRLKNALEHVINVRGMGSLAQGG